MSQANNSHTINGAFPSPEELGHRFQNFLHSLARPVVFFDTETTGTDPAIDRIIEISLLRASPLPIGIEPPRTWRLNPGIRIPAEASQIHGIRNEDVANAPTFADVAAEILQVVDGADLAGFNVGRFDVRVLQTELMRVGKSLDLSSVRIVDAQVIYHQREPRNLGAAVKFYCGKELLDAHGACADTLASLIVFAGQLERYPDLTVDIQELHTLSSAYNSGFADGGRRFVWRDNEPVFNFGKLRGKSLRWAANDPNERAYLRWILQGTFEDEMKAIVKDALEGRIRTRGLAEELPEGTRHEGAGVKTPGLKAPA